MKQKTRWYVEPQDSYTNKVIQRELKGAEVLLLKTNLRQIVHGYEVDHHFITNLKNSKDDLRLKFKVHTKQSKNALVREFDFSFLSKKKKK